MTDQNDKLPTIIRHEFTVTVDVVEAPLEDGQPYTLTKAARTYRDLPSTDLYPWELK